MLGYIFKSIIHFFCYMSIKSSFFLFCLQTQDIGRYHRKVASYDDINSQFECGAKVLISWNSILPKTRATTFSYQNKVIF